MTEQPSIPLAVVGVSALFPGSLDEGRFWHNIVEARDLITDVPETHWLVDDYYDPDPSAPDRTYGKRGGFLPKAPFDPMAFGVPPSIMEATDTSQLLALIVAQRVLDDAWQGQFASADRSRLSVILGVTSAQELLGLMVSRLQQPVWRKALRETGLPESKVDEACERIASHYVPWQEATFPGLLGNVVAGRIANRFDIGGTNCVTDAACASSFSALSMAANELYLNHSDVVVVGGVDTMNDPLMYMCFSKTPALSATGDCRPFSDQADGTMLGEGLGMVALKRLDDAERDGDAVYAVLRGIGSSSDGRAKSVYAPRPEGQALALRRAYERAGYSPRTVELVEAHGTGTKAGDVAEFEGLRMTFGGSSDDTGWCALGSVKSQIGHTKAAAGAAGLFKAVMAVHHGVLPPTLKVERPNPKMELDASPFYISTDARPWVRASDHPRRAGISSFGFGGTNFHITVEGYDGPAPRAERLDAYPAHLVVASDSTPEALASSLRALADRVSDGVPLGIVARDAAAAWDGAAAWRAAVVATDADAASQIVRLADLAAAGRPASTPDGRYVGTGESPGAVAVLFPGQGSQYVGMGADLAMHMPEALAAWDRAADTRFADARLADIVFPAPRFDDEARDADEARLRATEWAQPALGVCSSAALSVLRRLGLTFEATAGHSYGELTALHAAGVFDASTLLRVSRARGERMRDAAADTPGAMAAVVDMDADTLKARLPDGVVLANLNSPRQIVVSGDADAVDALVAEFSRDGVRAKRLPVATAFHSPIVAPAADAFAGDLAEARFESPRVPVYANSIAAPYPDDADAARALLGSQIAQPVRFSDLVQRMADDGVGVFVEVGAGDVLTRLVSDSLGDRPYLAVSVDRRGRHGVVSMLHAVGALLVSGVALEPARLYDGVRAPIDHRPAPGRMSIDIDGANHDKPYPPRGGAAALPPPNPEPAPEPARPAPATPSVSMTDHPTKPAPNGQSGPPQPAPPAPSSAPADVQLAWIEAYRQAQQATANAHAAYQFAMSQAHTAFLAAAQASYASLGALAGVPTTPGSFAAPPAPAPVAWTPPAPAASYVAPPVASYPAPAPAQAAPVHAPPPFTPPVAATMPAPAPAATPPAVRANGATNGVAAYPTPAAAAPVTAPTDARTALFEVVSDKTGYPVEMLGDDMALEADLGIDSIKRVEILSALTDRLPHVGNIETSETAGLQTLGDIIAFLDGGVAVEGAPAAPAPTTNGHGDVRALLFGVVSDKTGYPVEMLEPGMELEADLGIDSIKRVEILSALSDAAPWLPQVETSDVAAITTLGGIVDFLQPPGDPAGTEERPNFSFGRFEVFEVPALPTRDRSLVPAEATVALLGDPVVCGALRSRLAERGNSFVDDPAQADVTCFVAGGTPDAHVDQRAALSVATSFAARASRPGAVFVVVQDTGGDFGVAAAGDPWRGGLTGLAKTAAQEWPSAVVRAIDISREARTAIDVADVVLSCLDADSGHGEVAVDRNGARATRAVRGAPVRAGDRLPDVGAVLVSGGARGVTAACVIALAKARALHFVLLGRTPLESEPAELRDISDDAALKKALFARLAQGGHRPTPADVGRAAARIQAMREVRATLDAIAATGATAEYVSVDVTDADAIAALASTVRARTPIVGVVHGAGVLADRNIADKTGEMFDRVFGTKIHGARALLDATVDDALAFIALFSSVAARSGNAGQSDYAMANEVLNRLAWREHRRRGDACVVRSMGWGPWDGGMVDASLRARFEAAGVTPIPVDVGARWFVDELSSEPDAGVEIVLGARPSPQPLVGAGHGVGFNVRADLDTYPFVADHVVRDAPVVPLALVAEWIVRAVHASQPETWLHAIDNLKVVRGVVLDGSDELRVEIDADVARVVDEAGRVRYAARVVTGDHSPAPSMSPALATGHGAAPKYGNGVLFHGPAFHLLDTIDSLDANGATAHGRGVRGAGWSGPWHLDAAAVDGALQLALVWMHHATGRASLPMLIGRLIRYAAPCDGPVRLELRASAVGEQRAASDVSVVDAEGRVVLELRGIETIARPDTA